MALGTERRATWEDLQAIPEGARHHEVINGALVPKARPSGKHGRTQGKVFAHVDPYHRGRPGPRGPGGWHFATEVEVELAVDQIFRPDVAGWKREHLPELPDETPVRVRPDWICEVLSASNSTNDTVKKFRVYHRTRVPHYWIVDPAEETLAVFRWEADGYLLVLKAERGERVRAEPFDHLDLSVGVLFGDDEDE